MGTLSSPSKWKKILPNRVAWIATRLHLHSHNRVGFYEFFYLWSLYSSNNLTVFNDNYFIRLKSTFVIKFQAYTADRFTTPLFTTGRKIIRPYRVATASLTCAYALTFNYDPEIFPLARLGLHQRTRIYCLSSIRVGACNTLESNNHKN